MNVANVPNVLKVSIFNLPNMLINLPNLPNIFIPTSLVWLYSAQYRPVLCPISQYPNVIWICWKLQARQSNGGAVSSLPSKTEQISQELDIEALFRLLAGPGIQLRFPLEPVHLSRAEARISEADFFLSLTVSCWWAFKSSSSMNCSRR